MEIFGIGPLELLMVFVLALIFIGPGKMPEVASSLGKALREFRAASAELTDALNAEIAEAERRKAEATATENGHSVADAAEAEVVAQGEIDAPAAVEYAPPEALTFEPEPVEPAPAPPATIDGVLEAIAQQEAEAAAKREAEEAARLAAVALERAIRNGVGPLPESLLMPSSDAPLTVVNPTEQRTSELAEAADAPPVADADAPIDSSLETPAEPGVEAWDSTETVEAASPEVASPEGETAETESEALEASGAGQAEVH